VNEGLNRWPAAHVTDVARLYRLALEKGKASTYHAVSEEGIHLKDIAAAIGRGLRVPVTSISSEEAQARFGRIGGYVGMDLPRRALGLGSDSVGHRPGRGSWKISTVCTILTTQAPDAKSSCVQSTPGLKVFTVALRPMHSLIRSAIPNRTDGEKLRSHHQNDT
jgi:hypothetical protein